MSTDLTTDSAAAALVMAQAQRRCLAFDQMDRPSRQQASSLIGRARARAANGDR